MTFDSVLSPRYPIYTRANVAEVFPEPVPPLMLDCGIPEAEAGWRDAWFRIGALEPQELSPDSLEQLAIVGGYCYLNASLLRLFGERAPGLSWREMDEQFLGEQPDIPPYRPRPGDVRPDLTARIGEAFQAAIGVPEVDGTLADHASTSRRRADRPDLHALDDGQLVARFLELMTGPEHFRRLFAQHLFATYMAAVPVGVVRATCAAAGRPAAALEILSAVGDVESARPAFEMWALSRLAGGSPELVRRGNEFLAEFGWRGPNEWDVRSPTWETHPEQLWAVVDALRSLPDDADPASHVAAARGRSEAAEVDILSALDDVARREFSAARRAAATWIGTRERTKANAIRLLHEARMAIRELGTRMVAREHLVDVEDIAFLQRDELDGFLAAPNCFTETILDRRRRHAYLSLQSPPFVLVGEAPDVETWARRDQPAGLRPARGSVLVGVAGSPGVAEGPARVARDDRTALELRPGEVLVAPLVDVSWSPALLTAAAVVTDVGAPLSHGMIVCRELGIPCVASVNDASRSIPDGAPVSVDGTHGTVVVL
jgi:pyruvate,water dikinase